MRASLGRAVGYLHGWREAVRRATGQKRRAAVARRCRALPPLRRRTVGLRLSQGNGREEEGDRSGVRIAEAEPNRGAAGDGENRAKGRGRGEMGGRGAVGRCVTERGRPPQSMTRRARDIGE